LQALETRTLLAGEFTDLGSSGIEKLVFSSMAWGDYDSDGDLDLVVSGKDAQLAVVTKLYRNDGVAGLTEVLPGVLDTVGDVTWADYDSDGNLDLLIVGAKINNFDYSSQLYHNNGNGTFSAVTGTGLTPINGQADWGDYDNDGRIDLAMNGLDTSKSPVSILYHNDGNGQFSAVNVGLTGLIYGSVSWGDANTDGKLDLLLTGRDAAKIRQSKLYLNAGQGSFSESNLTLAALDGSSSDWGDYDNDGDQDLVLNGQQADGAIRTVLYKNDGAGSLTEVNSGLTQSAWGDVRFGESDNDGRLDILLTGINSFDTSPYPMIGVIGTTVVEKNNGNGTFTHIAVSQPEAFSYSTSVWGDYDNDGDLDIAATGSDQTSVDYTSNTASYRASSSLIRNNASTGAPTAVNSLPGIPTSPNAVVAGNGVDVVLNWTAPADAETPSAGMSYNLRVGTTPGGSDLYAPMVTGSGKSLLSERGRVQGTSYTVRNIPGGTTIYWSVQAVDSTFATGGFSPEQSISTPLRIGYTSTGANGLPALDHSAMAWGDFDNDQDLDLLLTGQNANLNPVTTLYRNDGNNTFTDSGVVLTNVAAGAVAWGDADNDGDLDMVLSGQIQNGNQVTHLYRNNGNSSFSKADVNLTGASYGSLAWGDADNDGDLDLVVTGTSLTTPKTTLYRNDGNFNFTEVTTAGLVNVRDSSVDWGDLDGDGDLDLLITGQSMGGPRVTLIYRNQGNFSFADINASIAGVSSGSARWGDSDNDGDLDILLAGTTLGGTRLNRVYINNGNSTFTDVNAGLQSLALGTADWVDADNDGDLDVLVTGTDGSGAIGSTESRFYRNLGGNSFTDTQLALGLSGSTALADYDNDGDSDVIIVGSDSSGNAGVQFYRSEAQVANVAPASPGGLSAKVGSDSSITFSWTAPTDNRTPQTGLSYNLRVGTTPGGNDVYSSSAISLNGVRLIPTSGAIQGTSYTLFGLNPGQTYYWSVQAIDTGLAGSPFAAEQATVLNFNNSAPVIAGAVANQNANEQNPLAPFASLTITDADTQDLFVRISIENGVYRGDFTPASTIGWTRTVVGNTIRYSQHFPQTANTSSVAQAAVRSLVFVPREGVPNKVEATKFTVLVNDLYASASDNKTTVLTTNVNDVPVLTGTNANQAVNDDATFRPYRNLKIVDADTQDMFARITIQNGVFRGDFTAATTSGWTRSVAGNNITYTRYYTPQTNIGEVVEAAIRAMVFQPRSNIIQPGLTETTGFSLSINDGLVNVTDTVTTVITTSVNNAPVISGIVAGQTLNDNQTKAVFNTLTVSDLDTQAMNVIITIPNGVNRGDFTAASATGWTRTVVGIDIRYNRYFAATANIGATVQAAIRALIFQPRTNVPVGTKETTGFTVFLNDGLANTTNSTTSVITTGVAPRPASLMASDASTIAASDITTVVLPSLNKTSNNRVTRLLKQSH
jgi:predicted nucleotidyltransferase